MSKQNKYWVYLGVINYKIHLDSNNRIDYLQVGNDIPQRRDCFGNDSLNRTTLKIALKYLLVAEPKQFKDLYKLVKENDMEMFPYLDAVVKDLGSYCFSLSAEE